MKKKVPFISLIIFIAIIFCPSSVLSRRGPNYGQQPGFQQLRSPIRLAMTPAGNFLVSDYQLGMIVTLDKNLNAVGWFTVQGKPLGVAYAGGRVYVGNTSNAYVEVYTPDGTKLFQLNGTINQPTDIAVDESQGLVFVVDGSQKKVKVFSLEGNFIRSFPGLDPNNEELTNPTGITVDPVNKEVFVSDYGDTTKSIWPRIQIFNYNGDLQDTIFGKQGMLGMRFSRPQGLAVDESGHVFMVDCYSGEIQVFDRYSGSTLKILGGYGTEPGQLRQPLDIVLDPGSKDIYVTHNRSAAIEIFKNGGGL